MQNKEHTTGTNYWTNYFLYYTWNVLTAFKCFNFSDKCSIPDLTFKSILVLPSNCSSASSLLPDSSSKWFWNSSSLRCPLQKYCDHNCDTLTTRNQRFEKLHSVFVDLWIHWANNFVFSLDLSNTKFWN